MSVTCIYRKATATRLFGVLVAVVVALFPHGLLASERADSDAPQADALHRADAFAERPSAASLLVSCPLSPLEILPQAVRENLVRSDIPAVTLNRLYSLTTLDSLTPGYARLKLTEVSDFTLNMVESKKGPFVVTVYTVGQKEGAVDSDIEFYTTGWKELEKKKLWEQPKVTDFLTKGDDEKTDLKKIAELVPFPTYEYTVSPDGTEVTGRLTVGKYLTEEANEALKPHIIPERTWRWDGKKFKLTK